MVTGGTMAFWDWNVLTREGQEQYKSWAAVFLSRHLNQKHLQDGSKNDRPALCGTSADVGTWHTHAQRWIWRYISHFASLSWTYLLNEYENAVCVSRVCSYYTVGGEWFVQHETWDLLWLSGRGRRATGCSEETAGNTAGLQVREPTM